MILGIAFPVKHEHVEEKYSQIGREMLSCRCLTPHSEACGPGESPGIRAWLRDGKAP